MQDALVERLFRGYFEQGFDLKVLLVRLAVEGGIQAPDVERLLAGDDDGRANVLRRPSSSRSA